MSLPAFTLFEDNPRWTSRNLLTACLRKSNEVTVLQWVLSAYWPDLFSKAGLKGTNIWLPWSSPFGILTLSSLLRNRAHKEPLISTPFLPWRMLSKKWSCHVSSALPQLRVSIPSHFWNLTRWPPNLLSFSCLLYTSDAADDQSRV